LRDGNDGTFEEELQRGPTGQQLAGHERLRRVGRGNKTYIILVVGHDYGGVASGILLRKAKLVNRR
jgi:hypothetical protein